MQKKIKRRKGFLDCCFCIFDQVRSAQKNRETIYSLVCSALVSMERASFHVLYIYINVSHDYMTKSRYRN